MTTMELLERIGVDNIRTQWMLTHITNCSVGKAGTKITFRTDADVMTPDDLMAEHPRYVPLLLWVPYDLAKKAQAEAQKGGA